VLRAGIRVYSPKGELLKTLPLEIKPGAICAAKDGAIFVAGDGRLLKLDATGKVLASAASPVANVPVVITKEVEDMVKQSKRPFKEEMQRMKTSLEQRRADVTGLAVTDQDVFMAVRHRAISPSGSIVLITHWKIRSWSSRSCAAAAADGCPVA